jgi:C-terminal processing protease CtpA/Prc
VLDLSCNGGGEACAGAFALCWFLGEAQVSAVDSLTGAESTVSFKADVNLDHQYDEKDSLSNLNLYCLISPQSFSCANLVTWAFKADGRVTLLGKTSGGGSCVVRQLTTAWGSSYQISCSQRMSFVKNGSYYDVDRGADPDFYIRDYDNYYDREALTEIINGIR